MTKDSVGHFNAVTLRKLYFQQCELCRRLCCMALPLYIWGAIVRSIHYLRDLRVTFEWNHF